MQTKSNIQLIKESIQLKNSIKESLNNIMDKYTVEDSVFMWRNGLNECTQGYFEVVSEFENLNEAIAVLNVNTQGIRILNNTTFQVGNIYSSIVECKDSTNQILDINLLETIR